MTTQFDTFSFSRQQQILELARYCDSFTVAELSELKTWQLDAIEATDCNWAFDSYKENGFATSDEAQSAALYATYEQVTDKYATENNF